MRPADAIKVLHVCADQDRERRWMWNATKSVRWTASAQEAIAALRSEWDGTGIARAIDLLGVEEAAQHYTARVVACAREMARSLPRQMSLEGLGA